MLLSGCTQHVPPPPFTDAELEAQYHELVDAAWDNTQLEGTSVRPAVVGDVALKMGRYNILDFHECLGDGGALTWQMSSTNGAPVFMTSSGATAAPGDALRAYACLAEYPITNDMVKVRLTKAQKEYLYDYYSRWVVPCLSGLGYELVDVPTRDTFLRSIVEWNPYSSVPNDDGLIDLAMLAQQCGHPYADLDVEHPDWPRARP